MRLLTAFLASALVAALPTVAAAELWEIDKLLILTVPAECSSTERDNSNRVLCDVGDLAIYEPTRESTCIGSSDCDDLIELCERDAACEFIFWAAIPDEDGQPYQRRNMTISLHDNQPSMGTQNGFSFGASAGGDACAPASHFIKSRTGHLFMLDDTEGADGIVGPETLAAFGPDRDTGLEVAWDSLEDWEARGRGCAPAGTSLTVYGWDPVSKWPVVGEAGATPAPGEIFFTVYIYDGDDSVEAELELYAESEDEPLFVGEIVALEPAFGLDAACVEALLGDGQTLVIEGLIVPRD